MILQVPVYLKFIYFHSILMNLPDEEDHENERDTK